MKKHSLGVAALLASIVALGFAVIPGIALDRPFPFADEERDRAAVPSVRRKAASRSNSRSFRSRSAAARKTTPRTSLKKTSPNKAPRLAGRQRAMDRDHLLKWFTITAVSCSLAGLTLGPVAWAKEKQPVLSGTAIGICLSCCRVAIHRNRDRHWSDDCSLVVFDQLLRAVMKAA